MINCMILDEKDTVATMLGKGAPGQQVRIIDSNYNEKGSFSLAEEIPFAFKVALLETPKGEAVMKAGQIIGVASQHIAQYTCVHVHNLSSIAGAYARTERNIL